MNPLWSVTLLFPLVGCQPIKDEGVPALVCGEGTHEEDGVCVVDEDTAATDSGDGDTDTDSDADTDSDTDTVTDTAADTDTATDTDNAPAEPAPAQWSGDYDLGDGTTLAPEHGGDYLGWSLDVNGDADGDGQQDLVVSAVGADENGAMTGSTYVWTAGVAADGDIEDARLRIDGDAEGSWSGYQALFLPDVDGDGLDEVVVSTVVVACSSSAGSPGRVGVFSGARTGTIDFSDGDALWTSDTLTDLFACGVASPGDLDGDGVADLVAGASGNGEAASRGGAAYVFGDPLAGGDMDDATTRLYSDVMNLGLGRFAGSLGDTDGDGLAEVGLGFTGVRSAGDVPSGVYVVTDPGSGRMYADDAAVGVILPETGSSAAQLGGDYTNPVAAAGDVDGDGYGDALVGAPTGGSNYRGVAYIVNGPLTGEKELFFALAKISGTRDSSDVGYTVESAHDVDGDGKDDVAIGAPGYSSNNGAVGIFVAPAGELDFEDATAIAEGDGVYWLAGYDLAVSDQTRDGVYDLVVGAVYAYDHGQDAGLVAVLPGGP